jgi:hypothetical protein
MILSDGPFLQRMFCISSLHLIRGCACCACGHSKKALVAPADTWLWCIAGDMNISGLTAVPMPPAVVGVAPAPAMFCASFTSVTNARPYLLGPTLKRLFRAPVESSAAAGEVHHGLLLPPAHARSVAKFCIQSHAPKSFDHVAVSGGTLRSTVLNMFEDPLFEGCFVAFAVIHPPPMEWTDFITWYASDHMPVCAAWTF